MTRTITGSKVTLPTLIYQNCNRLCNHSETEIPEIDIDLTNPADLAFVLLPEHIGIGSNSSTIKIHLNQRFIHINQQVNLLHNQQSKSPARSTSCDPLKLSLSATASSLILQDGTKIRTQLLTELVKRSELCRRSSIHCTSCGNWETWRQQTAHIKKTFNQGTI